MITHIQANKVVALCMIFIGLGMFYSYLMLVVADITGNVYWLHAQVIAIGGLLIVGLGCMHFRANKANKYTSWFRRMIQ